MNYIKQPRSCLQVLVVPGLILLLLTSCGFQKDPLEPPQIEPRPESSRSATAQTFPEKSLPGVATTTPSMLDSNPAPAKILTPTPAGIPLEMDQNIPPIPPAQLSASIQEGKIVLSWLGTGSDIDTHYAVYRRIPDNNDWIFTGAVLTQGDNTGAYTFLDETAVAGVSYEYAVASINRYGNESQPVILKIEIQP